MDIFEKIHSLDTAVRDIINLPRQQYLLLQNRKGWNQVCSALDLLGDTTLAIEAYKISNFPDEIGGKYLNIYGILQALFLQQDAISHISEVLDIHLEFPNDLKTIRDTRNVSIGHPSKKGSGKKQTSHFISRATMHKGGFELMSSRPHDDHTYFRTIDLIKVIEKQQQITIKLLEDMVRVLNQRDEDHKNRYRDMKLSDIFPPTIGYYFSKILEGTHSQLKANREWGKAHVELVLDKYDQFRQELEKRGELPANEVIEYELKEILYSLQKLKQYFQKPEESNLEPRDAAIFAEFTRNKHGEIAAIAKEIDTNYQEKSEPQL